MISFVGGKEYIPGITAFRCLVMSFVPIAISNIIGGQILIPAGMEKQLLAAEISGAITNLILNLCFIMKWGIVGAAISTVIAEIVVTVYTILVVKREMRVSLFTNISIVKQTVTATLTGVVIYFLVNRHVFGENPFVVLCMSAFSFFILDFGLLWVVKEEITQNEIWKIVKAVTLIIIKKINQIRLVVGKDTGKLGDVSKLVYCPCCGYYAKSMVYNKYHWYPKRYNPNLYLPEKRKTECPNCGAFPRHRLLMWYFMEHVNELKASKAILYFACEDVVKGWLDDNNIKYTTADLFAQADIQIDIEDTGLNGNTYDYIVCNHVLEHVNDFKRALKEVYRILAPNAIFICSFPILDSLETYIEASATNIHEAEKVSKFGQRDHMRIFGRDSKDILEGIGFSVEVYDRTRCPEYIVPKDGPGKYDKTVLFICKKVEM